jgi:protein phosphatase
MDLKVGCVSDRGLNPKRPVNQDFVLTLAERGLFAVFDGVGGHRAGEVASQTAAETIEETLRSVSPSTPPAEVISRAIQFANRDILELAETNPSYGSMATTVALVKIDGDRATLAHLGDSRVYILENGTLRRETIDHTDFNDLMRAGMVAKDSEHGPDNHIINRALGVEPNAEAEMKTIPLREGARLLLCTDGIYRHLSDGEIADVLATQPDPQLAADRLKQLVFTRGAEDNLSAVVVQVDGVNSTAGQTRSVTPARADLRRDSQRSAKGRIQVELARPSEGVFGAPSFSLGSPSVLRKFLYVVLLLLALAAAFYAGVRASRLLLSSSNSGASESLYDTGPVREGREKFNSGDYQGAVSALKPLVDREPNNGAALYWFGRALLEQGQFKEAAQSLERASTLEPANPDALVQAAAAYQSAGEPERARDMLRQYGEIRKRSVAAPAR